MIEYPEKSAEMIAIESAKASEDLASINKSINKDIAFLAREIAIIKSEVIVARVATVVATATAVIASLAVLTLT